MKILPRGVYPEATSATSAKSKLIKPAADNASGGLPCGFVAQGPHQKPEKPTFRTSDDVPVLLYPAGSYGQANVPDAVNSEHGSDQLVLQGDGNLVLYCMSCTPVKPLWSSQTQGKKGRIVFFQSDGDLVLRNDKDKVIWHSNIHSKCPGSARAYFTLQDDGNLAMLYDEGDMKNEIPNQNSNSPAAAPPVPGSKPTNNNNQVYTYYLGGTATTNDQASGPHPGKIQ